MNETLNLNFLSIQLGIWKVHGYSFTVRSSLDECIVWDMIVLFVLLSYRYSSQVVPTWYSKERKIQTLHNKNMGLDWYFVTKIVLTYCEKKLFYWSRKTFEIWGRRPRVWNLFEITRTIYSNSGSSEQFLTLIFFSHQIHCNN